MTHITRCSGLHLIADVATEHRLGDLDFIEAVLKDAAAAACVTLLDVKLHHFGEGHGVTGVALLAESHISIHTWPECGMAAVDIFVCGEDADPQAALDLMVERFAARITRQQRIERLLR